MMDRSQILFELAALDVNVNDKAIQEIPDAALHQVLIAVKRLIVMSTHWTNPKEAHEMQSKEGMRICAFCRAPLEA